MIRTYPHGMYAQVLYVRGMQVRPIIEILSRLKDFISKASIKIASHSDKEFSIEFVEEFRVYYQFCLASSIRSIIEML